MLLTNRRIRTLYIALAGMEVGWIAPFALLFLGYWLPSRDRPWSATGELGEAGRMVEQILQVPAAVTFALLLVTMLCYMLAADLLNMWQIDSPGREIALVALLLVSSFLGVRLLLHPGLPFRDSAWIGATIESIFNFTTLRRPELAIVFINLFLWFRVAVNTDRSLSFFSVGLGFRLGLLLALLGGVLFYTVGARPMRHAITYFVLFFAFGLVATSLARIDEKSVGAANSGGALLPWSRLLQIVLTVLVPVGLALGLAYRLYTPDTIRHVIGWFAPLWQLISNILLTLLFALVWLLSPLIEFSINFLRGLFEAALPADFAAPEPGGYEEVPLRTVDIIALLDNWTPVRYALVILAIIIAFALIWVFFVRTRRHIRADEAEGLSTEPVTLDPSFFIRGIRRLRDLARLLGTYGLGRQLLAAISIQNIYANISRLAARRGFPRHPAEAPDQYVAALQEAFPGCDSELARITDAYMRVHYGDQSIDGRELEQLRVDYRRLQSVPQREDAGGEPNPSDQSRD